MAIDPRIPLMIRPPEIDQAGDAAQRFMPMAQMLDANAMKQAYVWGPDGELDRNATIQNLSRINPGVALQLQNQLGLQDKWDQSADLRQEELKARIEAQRAKLIGNALGKIKGNLADSWGAFTFQGDPEAARQSYRQSMEPIWQAVGMSPEQIEQAASGWSPENVQQFLSGQQDGALQKMAERAVQGNAKLFWDTGEPAYAQNYAQGEGGEFIPTGPEQAPGVPEWAVRSPKTPEDWANWNKLISVGKQAKWFKGSEQQLVTPYGVFDNPYWERAQLKKQQLDLGKYAEQQKLKKPDTVFMGGSEQPLTKPTQNDLQGRVVEIDSALSRLDNMIETFKPEFLTIPEKAKQKVVGAWASMGLPVDEATKQRMGDFAWFMSDSYDNMNLYIKMITGAAMSQPEAERIGKGIPNPDTDNPIAFESKLRRSQIVLRRARDVYANTLEKGLSLEKAERAAKDVLLKGLGEPEKKAAPKTPAKPSAEGAPAAKQHAGKWYTAPDGSVYQSDGETWVLKGKK